MHAKKLFCRTCKMEVEQMFGMNFMLLEGAHKELESINSEILNASHFARKHEISINLAKMLN